MHHMVCHEHLGIHCVITLSARVLCDTGSMNPDPCTIEGTQLDTTPGVTKVVVYTPVYNHSQPTATLTTNETTSNMGSSGLDRCLLLFSAIPSATCQNSLRLIWSSCLTFRV